MQEFSASGFAAISGNNLTGCVELNEFSLLAKWSKVGNLQIDVIEVCSFLLNFSSLFLL